MRNIPRERGSCLQFEWPIMARVLFFYVQSVSSVFRSGGRARLCCGCQHHHHHHHHHHQVNAIFLHEKRWRKRVPCSVQILKKERWEFAKSTLFFFFSFFVVDRFLRSRSSWLPFSFFLSCLVVCGVQFVLHMLKLKWVTCGTNQDDDSKLAPKVVISLRLSLSQHWIFSYRTVLTTYSRLTQWTNTRCCIARVIKCIYHILFIDYFS